MGHDIAKEGKEMSEALNTITYNQEMIMNGIGALHRENVAIARLLVPVKDREKVEMKMNKIFNESIGGRKIEV